MVWVVGGCGGVLVGGCGMHGIGMVSSTSVL